MQPQPASRRIALVTGASTGIGLELSRILAGDRHDLMIVAQRADRLAQAARDLGSQYGIRVIDLAVDLGDSETPGQIARVLSREGLVPDVLVNNAGFGLRGPFADLDLGRQLQMIQVNIHALTHLTGLLLPGMLARRSGRVLNVASTAAFQPGPMMAVYYASKAYVLSLSEALAEETSGSGVTVTALCPGPTATSFEQRAGLEGSRLFGGDVMEAADVARYGYDAMLRGARIAIPGWRNRLKAQAVRFFPRAMVARVARSLQEGPAAAPPGAP
jgi:short-subunit dehydrogenase